MPASLGPKPAGCTETLTITMVQQLLFISSSTLRKPTPDHTLTHRTHTPFLHTDTYMIHCLGGRGGKGGGTFFCHQWYTQLPLNLVVEQLHLPASTGVGKKKRKNRTRNTERKQRSKERNKNIFLVRGSTRAPTRKLLPTILSPKILRRLFPKSCPLSLSLSLSRTHMIVPVCLEP